MFWSALVTAEGEPSTILDRIHKVSRDAYFQNLATYKGQPTLYEFKFAL